MANQWVSRLTGNTQQSSTAHTFKAWALGVCVRQSSKGIAHNLVTAIDVLATDIRTGKLLIGPAEDQFISLLKAK